MIVDIDDPFLATHSLRRVPAARRTGGRREPRRLGADLPVDLSPAARLCGPASRGDVADDIVSETMTRAIANIAKFRPTDAGMDPWLFGIARRVAADHHRQATGAERLS